MFVTDSRGGYYHKRCDGDCNLLSIAPQSNMCCLESSSTLLDTVDRNAIAIRVRHREIYNFSCTTIVHRADIEPYHFTKQHRYSKSVLDQEQSTTSPNNANIPTFASRCCDGGCDIKCLRLQRDDRFVQKRMGERHSHSGLFSMLRSDCTMYTDKAGQGLLTLTYRLGMLNSNPQRSGTADSPTPTGQSSAARL